MSSPRVPGAPDEDRVPWWLVATAVAAAVAVLALVVVVVLPGRADDAVADPPESSSTTPDAADTTEPPDGEEVVPAGRVAYVDASGAVLIGSGAEPPTVIAADAALGEAEVGAVAIAPTGDVLAYVRNDGALVVVPLPIGDLPADPPSVVATDVALDAVGAGGALAWDAAGARVAYLAVGTQEMAEPRPDEPPPLSVASGVFRTPLPEGVLGNVVRVVGRDGSDAGRIGDPSTRSMVGIAASGSDDLMVLESVAPDTGRPYTLVLATFGADEETPTLLSADEPDFAPDGSFLVAVGPDREGRELVRISTDTLDRDTLVADEEICDPAVSPDSTRIVYGVGEDCSRLEVVSSSGGAPVEITPPAGPGDRTFRRGGLGWSAEGRFVTFPQCAATDGPIRCGGPVTFLEPDQRRIIDGPTATTVVPYTRPLLQELRLDLAMAGPIEYEGSFPVTAELESDLTELDGSTSRLSAELVDGDRTLRVDLQVQQGADFATGQLTLVDPEAGIDRTFLVLGTPVVIGVRVASLSGIWISTDELPVISGEFRLAVRRT